VIKVLDDYTDQQWFDKLVEYTKHPDFWGYTSTTDYEGDGKGKFTHLIYGNNGLFCSHLHQFMEPFYNHTNQAAVIRNKIDFTLKTETHQQGMMHNDIDFIDVPYKTGILYLTTNNGYTLFEDGTKVESVANRFVMFDGHLHKHCVVSQTDVNERICLNINWIPMREQK
jgi:Cu/Ag efflux protein CusF